MVWQQSNHPPLLRLRDREKESGLFYFAAYEKGEKPYWSRLCFRLDETYGLAYVPPPPNGCHPSTK